VGRRGKIIGSLHPPCVQVLGRGEDIGLVATIGGKGGDVIVVTRGGMRE
jgi:hypothetical protein